MNRFNTFGLALILCLCGPAGASSAGSEDFWQWLAPQLHLSELEHPQIDYWEARHRRRFTELEVIISKGSVFLYPLALAVRDRDMPMELALLPIIESHLNPSAVSNSGARGLWQILPSTAKHLDLKHDWWFDESADFNRSTEAALDYLSYLHDRFGGWPLTLAAYNGGESRVHRQMREHKRRDMPIDFWTLELPKQTRAYIPKLLGLARVLRDPQGLKLPAIRTQRQFVRLPTGGPLDVAQVAELAKVSVAEIYQLNPQLLRWTTPPQGPHAVYLPRSAAPRFKAALQKLPAGQRRHWQRYVVKSGDSLGQIALDQGSNVTLIKRLNQLDSDRLKLGQILILANHAQLLDDKTLAAARNRDRVSYASRPIMAGYHEVRSGESLWSIARRYGSSVEILRHQNNLSAVDNLFPGQLIRIGNADTRQRIYYEVRPGDMLSFIAERYRVSVREIRSWNNLSGTLLHPGQTLELRLPLETG